MISCAIYLGSGRKHELALASPILVASGALGYAPADRAWCDPRQVGAFVTPPLTWQPQGGAEPPRLTRTVAGFLLHTGRRNPGLRAALKSYGKAWRALETPVIAALYGRSESDFAQMGAHLSSAEGIAAVELHLPHAMGARQVGDCIRACQRELALPCLARLPFANPVPVAVAAQEAGADALIATAPPLGRGWRAEGGSLYGPLHSPALAPLYAQTVYEVAQRVEIPIIGRGGVAEPTDALALLAAGASAVQLDSILYLRPAACGEFYAALEREMERRQAANWDELLAKLRQRDASR